MQRQEPMNAGFRVLRGFQESLPLLRRFYHPPDHRRTSKKNPRTAARRSRITPGMDTRWQGRLVRQ